MTPSSNFRGLALLVGAMYGLDIFSAYMSSPWSTEAFGADAERAASARRLIGISVITAITVGGIASYLDRSWYAVTGAAVTSAAMLVIYEQALAKGQAKGYQGADLNSGS